LAISTLYLDDLQAAFSLNVHPTSAKNQVNFVMMAPRRYSYFAVGFGLGMKDEVLMLVAYVAENKRGTDRNQDVKRLLQRQSYGEASRNI
jgi:hypothetical protein